MIDADLVAIHERAAHPAARRQQPEATELRRAGSGGGRMVLSAAKPSQCKYAKSRHVEEHVIARTLFDSTLGSYGEDIIYEPPHRRRVTANSVRAITCSSTCLL